MPFPAGGPSDVLSRLIGRKLNESWGQAVVIENRPGANTVIGAQIVAKAPADGYTLLMAIDSTLVMNQFMYRTPPYHPIIDFAPVTLVAKTMQLLMVNAESETKSVAELIARAKAAAGRLNYGAGTLTTKLTGFLFNRAAGITTTLVPYNGSADVTQALLTRSVDLLSMVRPRRSRGEGFHQYDNAQSEFVVAYTRARRGGSIEDGVGAPVAHPFRFSFGVQQQTFYSFAGGSRNTILPVIHFRLF